jgi:DNA-binding SARP family transcriptional activator/predicted ATPase
MKVRIEIFGTVKIRQDDTEIQLTRSLPGYVLRILVLSVGAVVSRNRLVGGIYEDEPPATAPAQLQAHVSRLRKALGSASSLIETVGNGYRLRRSDAVKIDVVDFDRLSEDGRAAEQRGDLSLADRCYRQALAKWGDLELPDPVAAEVDGSLSRLHRTRIAVLASLVEIQLRLRQHVNIIPELEVAVRANPHDERLRRLLVVSLYRAGRQDRALEEYEDIRRTLNDQLGVIPGPDLQRLHQQILCHDTALLDDPRPPARVNRLSVPRQLPPLPTGPNDLHAELPPLCKALTGHDGDAHVPIAVISGPGGIGKTTLAIQVAHELVADHPDGQLFVDLAGTSSRPVAAGAVLAGFLEDLTQFEVAVPNDTHARAARFRTLAADRRLLIVLDDAQSAAQVAPLLPGAPSCTVIVTSRAPLTDLRAATTVVSLGALRPREALSLLDSHVGSTRLAAELDAARNVVDLCAGSPLAIDVLGARLAARKHWSLARVVNRLANPRTRLDELEVGDRGVRGVLHGNYQRLDTVARSLLRGICLLGTTRFTLSTVAAVGNMSLAESEDRLDPLIDAHFVTVDRSTTDAPRYRCDPLTLAYGLERSLAEDSAEQRYGAVAACAATRWSTWTVPWPRCVTGVLALPPGGRPPTGHRPSWTSRAVWPVPVEHGSDRERRCGGTDD